jgi:microcystin degradation protein MlrC
VINTRIVFGGISHETNTFSPHPTELKDFSVIRGEEILKSFKGSRGRVTGIIDGCLEHNYEPLPTIYASGSPSGTITKEALDTLLRELLKGIKDAHPFDGVLLILHGAGVSESYDDIEDHIVSEVRNLVGDKMPLIATLDFHSNYTKIMVDIVDVLIGYDTNPHVDGYERSLEAIRVIKRLIDDSLKPTKAFRQPLMIPLEGNTNYHPMKTIMDRAHEMETIDGVETITVAQGFCFSDIEFPGMSIIVTTNDNQELAEKYADELCDLSWSLRRDFLLKGYVSVKEGIKRVKLAKEGPIVLADTGDVVGGGGTSKGTIVLKALLEAGIENGVVSTIHDPEAVAKAIEAGVGNEVTLNLGGKIDKIHGEPIKVTGLVKIVSDGKYIRKGPMSPGGESNMGRTVVLQVSGIDIIITSERHYMTDLQGYRSLNIEPTDKKVIVIKGSSHFTASHGPIAKDIIFLDTPGLNTGRLASMPFKKLRRPIFPLDVEMLGITELKTVEAE